MTSAAATASAGLLDGNPRVRPNLRYVRQEQDGKTTWVVKDPVTLRYFRFGQMEAWLMQRMDGTRSVVRLAEELLEGHGVNAKPSSIEVLVRRLREMGLAERSASERSLLLLEEIRKQRRVRLQANKNTLLRMRLSFGDPDRLFSRIVEAVPFFWTRGFVAVSAVVFALYLTLLASQWRPFVGEVAQLFDPSTFRIRVLIEAYVLLTGIALIHEIGHGLTCKRFGGEVHEMGVMGFYFQLAFFCNVTDAYTFEKRSHRLWVTFAGAWIQLWVAAFAAFLWWGTEPGTGLHYFAFIALLMGGIASLLLNFNPLLPLDGYYALVDYLDIPNLRPRAFAFVGASMKHRVLGLDVPIPPVTPRERRIFLVYGTIAALYSTAVLILVCTWVGSLLVTHLGWGWGSSLLGLLILRLTTKPRSEVTRLWKVWAAENLPRSRVRRIALMSSGALGVCVLFLLLVPWTVRAPAVAVVEPAERTWLRAPEAALIADVHVREGGRVEPGDTVIRLRAPEIELEWTEVNAALAALEREAQAASARGDRATARVTSAAANAERQRRAALERRLDALVLRAPFAAILATAHLDERRGAAVAAGDPLADLWGAGALRARLSMEQRDAGDVRVGTRVRMRFPSFPGWTWSGVVAHVGVAAADGRVEALAPLGVGEGAPTLRAGMTGVAHLSVQDTDLAGGLMRLLRRTFRLDVLFL